MTPCNSARPRSPINFDWSITKTLQSQAWAQLEVENYHLTFVLDDKNIEVQKVENPQNVLKGT